MNLQLRGWEPEQSEEPLNSLLGLYRCRCGQSDLRRERWRRRAETPGAGYYEVKFAFEGLADENVWKRPAEGLLSVGELAGHIAYWEAVRLAGEGEEPEKCRVSSLLIDPRFGYLPDDASDSAFGAASGR